MSRHSFDPEVAAEVGLNAAVIYQNIRWWCEKNAANDRHCHEGRHWTYNSVKAFGELFPYLTTDQIRRALERLEAGGYIGVGNFNQSPYDKTKWFCDLRQVELAKMPNRSGEDAEPIPDTKPDKKPEESASARVSAEGRTRGPLDEATQSILGEFLARDGAKRKAWKEAAE